MRACLIEEIKRGNGTVANYVELATDDWALRGSGVKGISPTRDMELAWIALRKESKNARNAVLVISPEYKEMARTASRMEAPLRADDWEDHTFRGHKVVELPHGSEVLPYMKRNYTEIHQVLRDADYRKWSY